MMFTTILILTTICIAVDLSNSEWEPLIQQLEEFGNGNDQAIERAKEILLIEAKKLDMPLPPGFTSHVKATPEIHQINTGGVNFDVEFKIKSEIESMLRNSDTNLDSSSLTIDLSDLNDLSLMDNINTLDINSVFYEIITSIQRMKNAIAKKRRDSMNKASEQAETAEPIDTRKQGQGEIFFGSDSLRFEWSMIQSGWKSLPDSTKKIWNNLDHITVERFPETRRMFEGHSMSFFNPKETSNQYRKASQRLISKLIKRELSTRNQLESTLEYDVNSIYPSSKYRGTNKQGYFSSALRNYTGEVSPTLQPRGFGILTEPHWYYKGSFVNGLPEGEGVAVYKNEHNCTYTGSWVNGTRHNLGTLECVCGKYVGHWDNDEFLPQEGDYLLSYPETQCNVSWSGVPSTASVICNATLVKPLTVTSKAFTGVVAPKFLFSSNSCPLVSQVESTPTGQCSITEPSISYKGECEGGYASGNGQVTITTSSYTALLNVTVKDKILKGPAEGIVNGKKFKGTIIEGSFSTIKSIRMHGILKNSTDVFNGHLVNGNYHGQGTLHQTGLNITLRGTFLSGFPHGLCTLSSNGNTEIVNYRHGIRHGVSKLYSNDMLLNTRMYHFGSVVEEKKETVLQIISNTISSVINESWMMLMSFFI